MKTTMTCSNCGEKAEVVRGEYDFKDSGLPVVLEGIELLKCDACGNVDPIIQKLSKIMRLIALAIIRKPYRLTGAEVRFLRKFLHMNGADFSALLKVDKTTLSKWENDAIEIGGQTDRLIRTIVIGLAEGLEGELKDVIEQFTKISDEIRPAKIRMNTAKMSYEYAT
jgi:DNA-binding transcriptional regulator YiaG